MADDLFALLAPVSPAGLELVDVELRSGVLLVTVDRPGGVDLEALDRGQPDRLGVLDELDPIPGRYTLEVSSPGRGAHASDARRTSRGRSARR